MPGANYVGKAGQLAVMSEFLLRGYNVAMPEVDVGDDVFVVHDRKGDLYRIQVKTTMGIPRSKGLSGTFKLPMKQLTRRSRPDLDYVLALRLGIGEWEFLIIARRQLREEFLRYQVGKPLDDCLMLYFSFRETEVICSGRSFQQYRNNWQRWPIIGK
jgi:hypothetical protein